MGCTCRTRAVVVWSWHILSRSSSRLAMKVFLFSFLLVDFIHGAYVGPHHSTPRCNTVTRDVCTDTVEKECFDSVGTVNTARECHSEYKTKCHTVSESVCHDETHPVCDTHLENVCHTEQKTETRVNV